MAEQATSTTTSPSPQKARGGVIWIFVGLTYLVFGAAGFLTYQSTLNYDYPQVTEAQESVKLELGLNKAEFIPVTFTMEPFTVNLTGIPRRMLRVSMDLEMLNDEGFEEVVSLGAEARDAIISVLNSKAFNQIEQIQGKLFLKDEIILTLNRLLTKGGVVKDIFFTEFVVQ